MTTETEIEIAQEFIIFVYEMFPQLVHIQDEEIVKEAIRRAAEVWLHADEYAPDATAAKWENTDRLRWNLPEQPVLVPIPEVEEIEMV